MILTCMLRLAWKHWVHIKAAVDFLVFGMCQDYRTLIDFGVRFSPTRLLRRHVSPPPPPPHDLRAREGSERVVR